VFTPTASRSIKIKFVWFLSTLTHVKYYLYFKVGQSVDKSVIGRPTCAYSMPACITMACVQSTAWRCLPQPVDTLAGYVNNRCMITDRDGRCGSFVFGWQWPLTAGWHISIEVSHYRLAQTVHTKHPLRPNAQKLTDNFEAALIDIDNVACTGGLSSVSKVLFF